LVALTLFLRSLGTPSILFCWTVWVVFGQAAGGYVTPLAWITLLLACTLSVIHERERQPDWRFVPRRQRQVTMPFRNPPPLSTVPR
jgi:hypothetical protein